MRFFKKYILFKSCYVLYVTTKIKINIYCFIKLNKII